MTDAEAKERVTEINSYISTAKNRQQGLFKLIDFLENCSSQSERVLLEKNCQFWLKTLFQVIENPLVSLHAKMAYYCFYLIVQSVRHLSPEINRIISTQFIDKSVQLLTSATNVHSKNALMCLNELMSVYRASCSQFRQKIEQFIFARLDSDSEDVIKWASICYSKLPFLCKSSANNSDLWHVYFKTMLRNANSILNDLFGDLEQQSHQIDTSEEMISENVDKPTTTPDQKLDMSTIFAKMPNKDVENLEFFYEKSARRFRAATQCLSYLFRPLNECVPLKIRPLEVVDFLKRIASFDYKNLVEQSRIDLSSRQLVDIMQEVYISAFRFYEDFFDLLKTNLLPYSTPINKYLVNLGQTLNQFKLNNALSSYYTCLTKWFSALGTSSAFNLISTSTIEKLIENLRPDQKAALRIEDSRATSSKKSDQSPSNTISDINASQLERRKDLIEAELKCLKSFIQLFNHKLSYDEFEHIQKSLIDIVCVVQYNAANAQKPYDQVECRAALYETVETLCESKNVRLAPPISIVINLFKNALSDSSLQIKQMAENVLRRLRAYTRPTRSVYLQEYTIGQQQQPQQGTSAALDATYLVEALQGSKFSLPTIVKNQQPTPTDFNHIKTQSSLFGDKSNEANEGGMRLRLNCEITTSTVKVTEDRTGASNVLTNSTNKRKLSEGVDVSMSEETAGAESTTDKSNLIKSSQQSNKQQRLEKKSPSGVGGVLKVRSLGSSGKKGMVNRSDDDDDDVIDLDEDEEGEEEVEEDEEEEAGNEEDEEFDEEEEDDEEYEEEDEEEEEEFDEEDEEDVDEENEDDEDEAVANEEGSEFTADDGHTDEISGIKPLDKTPEERKIVVESVKPEHQIQDSESALCNTEVERIISHQQQNSSNSTNNIINSMPPPSNCVESQSRSNESSNNTNTMLNQTKEPSSVASASAVASPSGQRQAQQHSSSNGSRSASATSNKDEKSTRKRKVKENSNLDDEEEEDDDEEDTTEDDDEEMDENNEEEEDEEDVEQEEEEEIVAADETTEKDKEEKTSLNIVLTPTNGVIKSVELSLIKNSPTEEKPAEIVASVTVNEQTPEKKNEPMNVDTTAAAATENDPNELAFKSMCSSLNLNALAKDNSQTASNN